MAGNYNNSESVSDKWFTESEIEIEIGEN